MSDGEWVYLGDEPDARPSSGLVYPCHTRWGYPSLMFRSVYRWRWASPTAVDSMCPLEWRVRALSVRNLARKACGEPVIPRMPPIPGVLRFPRLIAVFPGIVVPVRNEEELRRHRRVDLIMVGIFIAGLLAVGAMLMWEVLAW